MNRRLCIAMLLLSALPVFAEGTEGIGEIEPEVRAVLFFAPDSPQYQDLFAFLLPGLLERYGGRLEISAIDVSEDPGFELYQATAARFGLSTKLDAAPTVLVGASAMVGLMEIAGRLGDGFEQVARIPGAADWPQLPGLEGLPGFLSAGTRNLDLRTAQEAAAAVEEGPDPSSAGESSALDRIVNASGLIVLVVMAFVLLQSLWRLRRRDLRSGSVVDTLLLVALVAGLGISGYTAYTALADVAPMCGRAGGCAEVQQSEYAKLFGVPMGVLGLLAYASILVAWLFARRLSPAGGGWRWVPWAIAFFSVLFSLRLTALGYFVIGASCPWCLGSAVSISVVLWLLSGQTRAKGRVTD